LYCLKNICSWCLLVKKAIKVKERLKKPNAALRSSV
jgi:hypothetical protein